MYEFEKETQGLFWPCPWAIHVYTTFFGAWYDVFLLLRISVRPRFHGQFFFDNVGLSQKNMLV